MVLAHGGVGENCLSLELAHKGSVSPPLTFRELIRANLKGTGELAHLQSLRMASGQHQRLVLPMHVLGDPEGPEDPAIPSQPAISWQPRS